MVCFSIFVFVIFLLTLLVDGDFSQDGSWPDIFEVTTDKLKNVTADNCHLKNGWELLLSRDYVSQVPSYDKLHSQATSANRTKLVHLHNTAMSRGLYFSFLYETLKLEKDFPDQPDIVHLYMKASADVTANQGWIDGSALMFDENCFYSNFMMVPFNQTLSLCGIRSFKGSNYDTTWLREPINSTNYDLIYGFAFKDNFERNYTDDRYKYCPYTPHRYLPYDYNSPQFWWPDSTGYKDSLRKKTYFVGVKFSDTAGQFKTNDFEVIPFYGPSTPSDSARDITLPVLITQPYFDCGRSNKWIVSMTSPVTENMPRYSQWTHLRRPRFTSIAAMDMEFERIDLNPCITSEGNPQSNIFSGTARCSPTTVCKPLSGYGFRRDGYQCVCKPGFYYPWGQEGPFQGVDVETASEEALNNGSFNCITAEELANYNGTETVSTLGQRRTFEHFDKGKWSVAQSVLQKAQSVPTTCDKPVTLSTGIIFGASEQFEAQGRTALGISHFISNFLQKSWALHDILFNYGEYSKNPFKHYLKEIHLFAEVLAPLMGDMKLTGVGVYFDRDKFATGDAITKEMFAPYAYKIAKDDREEPEYRAIDLAGIGSYPDEDWFLKMKQKFASSMDNMTWWSESSATYSDAHTGFWAPRYTDGIWSGPMYKCDNMLSDWVFTYRVPFVGRKYSGPDLEFKGVVAVDVKLEHLDINQCPGENLNNDVFSNTAKCHFETQYCVSEPGRRFAFGGYKCVFRQGYAIPANFTNLHNVTTDSDGSFSGETMEEEYEKKARNEINSYDDLKGKAMRKGYTTLTSTSTTEPLGGQATSTTGHVGGARGLGHEYTALSVGICILMVLLCKITCR